MAKKRFSTNWLKEMLSYFLAFSFYGMVLHLFGVDPDTYGDGWGMFGYYIVLNILTIPTAGWLLALYNRYKRNL